MDLLQTGETLVVSQHIPVLKELAEKVRTVLQRGLPLLSLRLKRMSLSLLSSVLNTKKTRETQPEILARIYLGTC